MDNDALRADTERKMATFDVRPPIPTLAAKNFSGGNQQKIVVAREIERNPDLLLIGQPTRGVDIGAIEFIHKQIVALRDAGKAILLVSVELDEIMSPVRPDRGDVRRPHHGLRATPTQTDERELGLLMAGIGMTGDRETTEARVMDTKLPTWADVVLVPLISLLLAAFISALVLLAIGQKPGRGVEGDGRWRAGVDLWLGLHALLRHHLHLHRACGDGGLPRRPVQHRRRGAGAAGRPGRGAGLPCAALAALDAGAARRDARARRCSARPGPRFRPGCRPSAAATS